VSNEAAAGRLRLRKNPCKEKREASRALRLVGRTASGIVAGFVIGAYGIYISRAPRRGPERVFSVCQDIVMHAGIDKRKAAWQEKSSSCFPRSGESLAACRQPLRESGGGSRTEPRNRRLADCVAEPFGRRWWWWYRRLRRHSGYFGQIRHGGGRAQRRRCQAAGQVSGDSRPAAGV